MLNSLLIWQYRGKAKAEKTINLLREETSRAFKNTFELAKRLNINMATADNLDLIGKHVGISRTIPEFINRGYFGFSEDSEASAFHEGIFYHFNDAVRAPTQLTDSEYRFFIKAKAMKNYQYPTIDNITSSAKYLLGDSVVVIDNYDMTMNIIFQDKNINPLILHAILNLDILCRPIGVMYRLVMITDEKPFGWESDSSAFGFNIGKFSRIVNVHNQ